MSDRELSRKERRALDAARRRITGEPSTGALLVQATASFLGFFAGVAVLLGLIAGGIWLVVAASRAVF